MTTKSKASAIADAWAAVQVWNGKVEERRASVADALERERKAVARYCSLKHDALIASGVRPYPPGHDRLKWDCAIYRCRTTIWGGTEKYAYCLRHMPLDGKDER